MNVIVWHESEGLPEIAVTIPAYGQSQPDGPQTDADCLAAAIRTLPAGTAYRVIDDADLTACDRYFRAAYRLRGLNVIIDMPAARGVHMDNIRRSRNTALAELDIPFIRALESGDTGEQRRIVAAKQLLRDIPQTLDLDTPDNTPWSLRQVWPAALKRAEI